MKRIGGTLTFLALALAGAACTSSRSDAGGTDERGLVTRAICESCDADIGGETGDLSPPLPPVCEYEREPIELDDDSLGFAPRDVLAYVEGDFDLPLRWQLIAWSEHEPATDFEDETEVHLEVRATEVNRVHSTPIHSSTPAEDCTDTLEMVVDLTIATADGALAGTLEGVRVSADPNAVTHAHARTNLSGFTGTLDLHPDTGRPHGSELSVELWFREGSLRGRLVPAIVYEDETHSEGGLIATETIEAVWPSDDCPPDYLPVTRDEAIAAIDGRTLGDVLDEAQARIEDANPIAGSFEGGTVDIELEIGDVDMACLLEESSAGWLITTTPLDIATSDGRLMLNHPAQLEIQVARGSGALGDSWLVIEAGLTPAAEFEDRYNYSGLSFGSWECGELRVQALYERASVAGQIEVDGRNCPDEPPSGAHIEHIEWCTSSPCSIPTNPFW